MKQKHQVNDFMTITASLCVSLALASLTVSCGDNEDKWNTIRTKVNQQCGETRMKTIPDSFYDPPQRSLGYHVWFASSFPHIGFCRKDVWIDETNIVSESDVYYSGHTYDIYIMGNLEATEEETVSVTRIRHNNGLSPNDEYLYHYSGTNNVEFLPSASSGSQRISREVATDLIESWTGARPDLP